MSKSLLLPLNNAFANGDLTVQIKIKGHDCPLNLILDTGSSTLVVDANAVEGGAFIPTQVAQHLSYGAGSWIGPVVKTNIQLGFDEQPGNSIELESVHLAIAQQIAANTFFKADGILGLAYSDLNIAHNVAGLLSEYNVEPAFSYPWPNAFTQLSSNQISAQLRKFKSEHITPYFDELVVHNIVSNEFAFVVHRSSTYQSKLLHADLLHRHPLNTGILVIGNPKSNAHLHKNDFVSVAVVHDKYYNVHLYGVGIKGMPKIPFPELHESNREAYISNGIVDSGASAIVLPQKVFTALKEQFAQIDPKFTDILKNFAAYTGKETGIPLDQVNLKEWPEIEFELLSTYGDKVILTLSPHTYWQTHAPEADLISFKITTLKGWPNQGILGLPLLNNYFTIFKRDAGKNGEIEFANRKFSPHKYDDTLHQNHQELALHFEKHEH